MNFATHREFHKIEDCTSRNTCNQCSEKHHTALHGYYTEKKGGDDQTKDSSKKGGGDGTKVDGKSKGSIDKPNDSAHMMTVTESRERREVFLPIVPLRIHGKNGNHVDTHALLDDCSQSTLIRGDIVQKLKLSRLSQYRRSSILGTVIIRNLTDKKNIVS